MPNVTVTIGIKALNEERHIGACLAGALAAVAPLGGEVVLADSGSLDSTVAIAQGFPVRIVQFANPAERTIGAAAQLAFQHSRGTYFYMLDGDMVPHPEFLAKAVAFLEANPRVAGVGGQMAEKNVANLEFAMRTERLSSDPDWRPGRVSRLDGGGVYRVAAIRDAGWFADRNLRAFEEFDLAARLRARGWELHRLSDPAMDHSGHDMGGYALLWRRFRSGYAGATGGLLRGALFQRHLPIVLRLGHIRNVALVYVWAMAILAWLPAGLPLAGLAALIVLPALVLRFRQQDWSRAIYTYAMWLLVAAGSAVAFWHRRTDPSVPIDSVDISPNSRPAGL